MGFWTGFGAALGLFVLLIAGLARARRRGALGLEGCRKSAHISMGLVSMAFPFFVREHWQIALLMAVFALLLVALRLCPRLLGEGTDLLRESRCESEGEFYFVAGVGAALFLARDPGQYAAALLLLTFADPAAAAVGGAIGRCRCWKNHKTFEGSIAFAMTAVVCLWLTRHFLQPEAALATVAVAVVCTTVCEAVAPRGSDNLTIPLAALLSLRSPEFLQGWAGSLFPLLLPVALFLQLILKAPVSVVAADNRSSRCADDQPGSVPSGESL